MSARAAPDEKDYQVAEYQRGSSIYFVKLEQVAVLPCLLYIHWRKDPSMDQRLCYNLLITKNQSRPYLSRMQSTTEGSLSLINEDRSDIEKYRGQQS